MKLGFWKGDFAPWFEILHMPIVFSCSKGSESRHLRVLKAEDLVLTQLYSSQHYYLSIAIIYHHDCNSPSLHRSVTMKTAWSAVDGAKL